MMKVVIAGFGFMGMTHAGNVIKNPKLQLCAIADTRTDIIRKMTGNQSGNFTAGDISAEDLSQVNVYENLADALKIEKPDACIIAVHTNMHYELAKIALEAETHVFLEKPFTLDVEEGERLIALARSVNKILMIGHVVRFMPAYKVLKQWIDSGEFGDLEFLSLSRFSGIPSWGQWKDKLAQFGTTGGALFDLVVHDIDYAQWVCGEPDKISASCLPGKLSKYDYVTALWKYTSRDVLVKIEGGNAFHSKFPFIASFTARFRDVSITYSSAAPENITVSTDSEIRFIPVGDANEGFSGELDYFFDCIINHKLPFLCTPDSSLNTIKICYRHLNQLTTV